MARPSGRGEFVGDVVTDGLEVWLWTGHEWIRGDLADAHPDWGDAGDAASDQTHAADDDGFG